MSHFALCVERYNYTLKKIAVTSIMGCNCFGGSRLEKKKSSANSHHEIDGKDLKEQS